MTTSLLDVTCLLFWVFWQLHFFLIKKSVKQLRSQLMWSLSVAKSICAKQLSKTGELIWCKGSCVTFSEILLSRSISSYLIGYYSSLDDIWKTTLSSWMKTTRKVTWHLCFKRLKICHQWRPKWKLLWRYRTTTAVLKIPGLLVIALAHD